MADRAGRRDPRSFEPPPWEQAQFQELAKLKTAEPVVTPEEPQVHATIADADTSLITPGAVADEVIEPQSPPTEAAGPIQTGDSGSAVDEAAMLEMMAKLAADEPPVVQSIWQLAIIASTVLGSIGLMMVVFGAVGLARTARTGLTAVLGGSTLISFGIGMIALAVWMAVRTLKQRGVL